MKTNPRMLAILRSLQREFALDYFEAELLGDDILANLESLQMDITRCVRAGHWSELAATATALEALGRNLGQVEIAAMGATLSENATAQDGRAEEIARRLDALLSELGVQKDALGPA